MNSWAVYDMANSVYSLCIATAIFPPFYDNLTSVRDDQGIVTHDLVSFFGGIWKNSVVYEYGLSIAFLAIAFLGPILSGIADYTGNKKRFMQIFVYLGAASCIGLFFFNDPHYKENILLDPNFIPDVSLPISFFILATIGFSGSIVFYNSYLPEICTPDRFEKLSAKGYAMGYAGSVVLLIINLLMIQMPDLFSIPDDKVTAPRIAFLTVGIWWAGISQITFFNLPSTRHEKQVPTNRLFNGFKELKKVFHDLKVEPKLRGFLFSFFFLSMGVQTVMFVAALFGKKELNMPTDKLIITVLLIQLIAIPGSYLFAWGANKKGNIPMLGLSTIVWISVCIAAYFTTEHFQFYIIAAVVGLVMGGVQSLCRATFTRLLNKEHDTASYYSFYDATEKIAIVLGTATYALLDHMYSMRESVLALMVFFIIAAFTLWRIRRVR